MSTIKLLPTKANGIFRKYAAVRPFYQPDKMTFDALESFAALHGFKIVDSYWSFDKEAEQHVPVIEVY